MAEKTKRHDACPYCDVEILEADLPFCRACQVKIVYCPSCRKPVARDKKTCPACGAKVKP